MPTIKDIAKKAGVSVATVSYVLNNRYVSPEKKERVLQAIKELNYVPNAVARGLRVRESRTISLIISDITNPFYPELAKACEDIAYPLGYTVNIINTNDDPLRMEKAVSQLREGSVDGMIVTTALEHDRSILEKIRADGYPLILAYRGLNDFHSDMVVCDNVGGAEEATRHLLKLGHRSIALMTGVHGSTVSKDRTQGYVNALTSAGIEPLPEWIISSGALYEKSYYAVKQLMKLKEDRRPTAVINISDMGALGVIDAAADMGMSVPDDMAVVGFDDLFVSAMRNVQLTTVRIPRYELGKRAAQMLFDRISNSAPSAPQCITLPVELIVRRTCGANPLREG